MANKPGYLILDGSGLKSSVLWDEETDAWTYYSNSPLNQVGALYRTIPVLYRGVAIISDTVTKVPFALYRGDKEIDTSASWDNVTEYMPNPRRLLKLTSQSLDRHGRAYWLKVRNRGKIVKELKWLEATSVTPFFDETTGELLRFERTDKKGRPTVYQPDDIVYFWLEDPDVEVGPPLAWPVRAGLQSAGVLHNLDQFISKYFEHGAVRPTMLMTKGFPATEEKDRIKAWWRGLTGIKHSREIGVFSADSIEPKQIGDGLDQLQNQELTDDQRKDVALALGIPQTILFANSANYATSQSDWLNFHETTIIPRCEMIAEVLNDQLFKAEGLEMRFEPEGLDIYREDENQRAGALGSLVNAGLPLLMAMDLLGYDLTPEQRAELEAEDEAKEERAEQMQEQMQQQPGPEQEPPANREAKDFVSDDQRRAFFGLLADGRIGDSGGGDTVGGYAAALRADPTRESYARSEIQIGRDRAAGFRAQAKRIRKTGDNDTADEYEKRADEIDRQVDRWEKDLDAALAKVKKSIEPMSEEAEAEAKHWRRICNKALRQGQPLPVDFVCEHIPAEQALRIAEALKAATDGEGIKRAFEQQEAIPLPSDWPMPSELLAELKRANDLLESVTR